MGVRNGRGGRVIVRCGRLLSGGGQMMVWDGPVGIDDDNTIQWVEFIQGGSTNRLAIRVWRLIRWEDGRGRWTDDHSGLDGCCDRGQIRPGWYSDVVTDSIH